VGQDFYDIDHCESPPCHVFLRLSGGRRKALLSEDRVRKTLIEGVRDYLIVSHLPVRDCVIVNMWMLDLLKAVTYPPS